MCVRVCVCVRGSCGAEQEDTTQNDETNQYDETNQEDEVDLHRDFYSPFKMCSIQATTTNETVESPHTSTNETGTEFIDTPDALLSFKL